MIRSVGLCSLCFLLLVFIGSPADAACMNCLSATGQSHSELACEGDPEFSVIYKCGKPDYVEESAEVTSGGFVSDRRQGAREGAFGTVTETVKKMYYNCGQGRFIKILVFRGGTLVSIQNADRGNGNERCW